MSTSILKVPTLQPLQTDEIIIRNLTSHEMNTAFALALSAGRNPGKNDPDLFFKIDNKGFIAAVAGNKLAGIISAVNYEKSFGFIGMHIISPEHKNNGAKNQLFSAALQKLGNINTGLNCFEDEIEYYEDFGFKPAHKIVTFEGIANGNFSLPLGIISPFMQPFESLLAYDQKIFPYNRKHFISHWLNQPGSLLLGKFEDDIYHGYGLFRPCVKGYKISNLLANDYQTAEEILSSLVAHLEAGEAFYIDVPDENEEGMKLAEQFNMKKIKERVRMYAAGKINLSLKNIFSFSSCELG